MYYDILDKKRLQILPLLKQLKKDFYLAGGTALALQIGHRDSIDFDFFSKNDLNTIDLFEKIKEIFKDHKIIKVQDEKNTLTVIIDENIKLSFFTYKYDLLEPLISEENFNLASTNDIACMKLSAVVSRATEKDYIDLYFILQNTTLQNLLKISQKKFPTLDQNLILKSLIYFDDIASEPITFKHKQDVDFSEVKKFLQGTVKNY